MIFWLVQKILGWPWCWHRWETEKLHRVVDDDGDQIGVNAYLRCEKCGDWKRRYMA